MPLQTALIRTILETHGKIRLLPPAQGAGAGAVLNPLITGWPANSSDMVVCNRYSKQQLTVSAGDNTIILTRVADATTNNNAVKVYYEDGKATLGTVNIPGYVYTDSFAGCVFYLYRTNPREIIGVHASSGTRGVEVKRRFRSPLITTVVREYSPTDYFTRQVAHMVCRYETRGALDPSTGEAFLAILSCVEQDTATTFLFSYKSIGGEYEVVRLVQVYQANV